MRLTRSWRSHSSVVVASSDAFDSTPALSTSRSTAPISRSIPAITVSMARSSDTSSSTGVTPSTSTGVTSAPTTVHPCSTSVRQICRPIPCAAPVTSATLPSNPSSLIR